jgi:hypothetical protein
MSMKKSGLTPRKHPLGMVIIVAASLADGWMSISRHGPSASFMGLAIAFIIPAAITFGLLWGIGSLLVARQRAAMPVDSEPRRAEELTSAAR